MRDERKQTLIKSIDFFRLRERDVVLFFRKIVFFVRWYRFLFCGACASKHAKYQRNQLIKSEMIEFFF